MLLRKAGFDCIEYLGKYHPFADYYAERNPSRYVISVRTRNKYLATGFTRDGQPKVNSAYNFRKRHLDPQVIALRHDAEPAWLTIQVDALARSYSAYFGTMAQITLKSDRYSVPMLERDTAKYECLARDECDENIRPEWSNRKSVER